MLSGKTRLHVETLAAIEALLAERTSAPRATGVAETPAAFQHRVRFITLEEAKAMSSQPRVRLSEEEFEVIRRSLREIGEAGRRLPRITDMTDDEILGYDEMP